MSVFILFFFCSKILCCNYYYLLNYYFSGTWIVATPPPFFLVPKSKFNLYSDYYLHLKDGQRKYDIDHKGRWAYIWTIQGYGNLVSTIKHQYIHYLVSGIIKSHGFCLLLSCVLQYGRHDHFTIDSVDYRPIWILKYLKR